jgi:hypothetical protein
MGFIHDQELEAQIASTRDALTQAEERNRELESKLAEKVAEVRA